MSWAKIAMVLVLAVGSAVSCREQGDRASAPRRQAAMPTASAGAAGQFGQASTGTAGARTTFSCGTAAGVCSCVPVSDGLVALASRCPNAECCFLDASGCCHCRLDQAHLDCAALSQSLGAQVRVASCPTQ